MIQEMENLKLAAQKRVGLGSNNVRRLRKSGLLPCVVYDVKGKSFPIQVKRQALEIMLRNRERQNLILDLEIEGEKQKKVLLKDTQRDFIKDHLLHADFLEVSMTRKLRVSVAIRLLGEPIGVSQQGGVMEHLIRSVDVECLPMDIVKELTLDVSNLAIGDTLCVRDIKADPKLTILTAPEITVVSVQLPHIEEEKPVEEAVEAEAAVEGAVPAEGEAAAAAPAEPGKEKEAKGKEGAKEAEEKGKEVKGKETKEVKGKESKDKAKG
jgi:large subunit ribosomal protein L25